MTELLQQIHQAAQNRLVGYPAASTKAQPGERRSEHSRQLATEALAAYQEGDWHRYYAAGYELLLVERQRQVRKCRQGGGDALTERIHAYIEEMPGASVADIVHGLVRTAESGCDSVLVDFDGENLTYDRAGCLVDVKQGALRRRVQRAQAQCRG